MCVKPLRVLLLILTLFGSALALPPRPKGSVYLNDYAHLLDRDPSGAKVQANLQSWNSTGKSRLFVVTVASLKEYQLKDMDAGAQAWFQEWKLDGKDLLLFVSAAERQARLQAGPAWSASERARAERLVEDVVTPLCASGDPAKAVIQGSYALHSLDIPQTSEARQTRPTRSKPKSAGFLSFTAFSTPVALGLFVLGAVLTGLGMMSARPALATTGVLIFAGTALSGLLVIAAKLAMLAGVGLLGLMFLWMLLRAAATPRQEDCRRHHCDDRDEGTHLAGALWDWIFSSKKS